MISTLGGNKIIMNKYRNRTIEKSIKNLIGKTPVIMITGARQVGKTTLLKYLTQNTDINYVSLDNDILRMQAIEDPDLFLRTYDAPLIIDEFQYAPNLLTYIKIKVDEARNNELFGTRKMFGTMYYLTGSQIFQTMENVSKSLAGRVGIIDLYGFSTRGQNKLDEIAFIPEIDELKNKEKMKKKQFQKFTKELLIEVILKLI